MYNINTLNSYNPAVTTDVITFFRIALFCAVESCVHACAYHIATPQTV